MKSYRLVLLALAVSVFPLHAFYDPETGEFITRDPSGMPDGPNQYAFVKENPWTLIDPEGLFTMYVETEGNGHVGASFGNGASQTNYDFGRYAGKYNWDVYAGPNVLKQYNGQPNSATKNGYASYDFNLSPELDSKVSGQFKGEFDGGQKQLPADLEKKLPDKDQKPLPDNTHYMGSDWGLSGPNCGTNTVDQANKAADAVLADPNASPALKKEATELKVKMAELQGNWTPAGDKGTLEKMAKAGEVTKTSEQQKTENDKLTGEPDNAPPTKPTENKTATDQQPSTQQNTTQPTAPQGGSSGSSS